MRTLQYTCAARYAIALALACRWVLPCPALHAMLASRSAHAAICKLEPLPCSYSEQLGKWIEVGNSGMFRPEMLQPMGMPDDVNVIAWGLSLERPTMILYGIDNIRDLFGHKVSLAMVRKNPMCRLGF